MHRLNYRHCTSLVVIEVLISEAFFSKALAPFSPNELLPHYVFALVNASKSLSVIICSGIILMYDSDYHRLLVCIDLRIHF